MQFRRGGLRVQCQCYGPQPSTLNPPEPSRSVSISASAKVSDAVLGLDRLGGSRFMVFNVWRVPGIPGFAGQGLGSGV